jgi:hypothetical protein
MPWPTPIAALLGRRDGRPAEALRWSLHALRGCLQAALDEAPDDPGAPAARDLIAELDALIDTRETPPGSRPPAVSGSAAPDQRGASILEPLARAMAADPRVEAELGPAAATRVTDEDAAWNALQRRLLRASPMLATSWRRRLLEAAVQGGARASDASAIALPGPDDELLYPGLEGSMRATGLRTSPAAALHPQVAAPPDDADLRLLARLVSAALWFVANDAELHHALQGVYRFGLVRLVGEQRERYVEELLRRWRRVCDRSPVPPADATRPWLKEYLRERIELDEALNSLIYLPPAHSDSWWAQLQGQARLALFRARDRVVNAGCPARLQRLAGSFPTVSSLADDSNLHVEYGTPGEVVACLRVYARIDGDDLRGRALYRPV